MTPKQTFINNLEAGQSIVDYFALAQAQKREAKNGPYWQLTLADNSGTMEARIWHPQSALYEHLQAEQFVQVQGQVVLFKDELQMNISALDIIDPQESNLDLSNFLPCSTPGPQELLAQIEALLKKELHFKPWLDLCTSILQDQELRTALLNAPGAKTIHHAYAGGLLEHTLGIMRICKAMAELYPMVDKEILLVAALGHDLGKAFELSQGISRQYTDPGRLLGHIHLGLEKLEPFIRETQDLPAPLVLHLKHLILAHHGELEFGAPKRPKTMEAFILHFADNLDAKINTIANALTTEDHGYWSDYQRSLERYLFQPMRTPQSRIKDVDPSIKTSLQQTWLSDSEDSAQARPKDQGQASPGSRSPKAEPKITLEESQNPAYAEPQTKDTLKTNSEKSKQNEALSRSKTQATQKNCPQEPVKILKLPGI